MDDRRHDLTEIDLMAMGLYSEDGPEAKGSKPEMKGSVDFGLGIGSVPGSVDPLKEMLAAWEAQEIMERQRQALASRVREDRVGRKLPPRRCKICGAPADMAASLGPACHEHYDDLSG